MKHLMAVLEGLLSEALVTRESFRAETVNGCQNKEAL